MSTVAKIAAVLLVAASGAAQAQSGSPARAAQDVDMNDNPDELRYEQGFRVHPDAANEAYRAALQFAECAARVNPKGVASILSRDANSAAESAALANFARRHGSCVRSRQRTVPLLIRGALAETLWRQSGAPVNPTRRTSIAITDVEAFIAAKPTAERVAKSGTLALGWIARCQVLAMPSLSAAVLTAPPASPQERAAADALYGKSQTCGVTTGLGATLVPYVRAVLADAFYQEALRSKLASR